MLTTRIDINLTIQAVFVPTKTAKRHVPPERQAYNEDTQQWARAQHERNSVLLSDPIVKLLGITTGFLLRNLF
eukprot:2443644-Amphidinium_carterae.1